jgi:hypothetical protein
MNLAPQRIDPMDQVLECVAKMFKVLPSPSKGKLSEFLSPHPVISEEILIPSLSCETTSAEIPFASTPSQIPKQKIQKFSYSAEEKKEAVLLAADNKNFSSASEYMAKKY